MFFPLVLNGQYLCFLRCLDRSVFTLSDIKNKHFFKQPQFYFGFIIYYSPEHVHDVKLFAADV